MSEQQEESEDRSYIQKDDIVLVGLSLDYDICKVISKSGKDDTVLYMQSIINSYSAYEKRIDYVSLLIPKENLSFQYKTEDDMFLAYNNGQLVINMYCPTYYIHSQTVQYANIMSNICAIRQLKETCKNEKVLELLKSVNYKYE